MHRRAQPCQRLGRGVLPQHRLGRIAAHQQGHGKDDKRQQKQRQQRAADPFRDHAHDPAISHSRHNRLSGICLDSHAPHACSPLKKPDGMAKNRPLMSVWPTLPRQHDTPKFRHDIPDHAAYPTD
jgi:hypothetical protein